MQSARLAAVLLLFSSCGSVDLDGSLSEAFDLTFSSVQIRRNAEAVQVSYLKSEGREVVIRLTVATAGVDSKGGTTIDLAGEYEPGHPRAAISRAIDGEPVRALPTVARGTFDLSDPPDPGKSVRGSFSLVFNQGGDIGAGRTLTGNFSGVVEAVP